MEKRLRLDTRYQINIEGEYKISIRVANNIVYFSYEYKTFRGFINSKSKNISLYEGGNETKIVSKIFETKKNGPLETIIENIKFQLLIIYGNIKFDNLSYFQLDKSNFVQSENVYQFYVLRNILRDIFLYIKENKISIDENFCNISDRWKFDIKYNGEII